MSILQAIILGIVQGITEFFPISSSGHLAILQSLFGLKEPQIAFDIFLHLGTLASVLIFFRKEISRLFTTDRKWLFFIIVASIPTFIIGFTFKDVVERSFNSPKLVAAMLGITGAWLILASVGAKKAEPGKGLSILNSILIGIAQGIAVMPGISRSGATIATGILRGLDKELAVRFSFLLAIPAILGASAIKLHKITQGITGSEAGYFLAGGITAMLAGIAAIKILLKLVKDNKLYAFGLYCICMALLGIIFL